MTSQPGFGEEGGWLDIALELTIVAGHAALWFRVARKLWPR